MLSVFYLSGYYNIAFRKSRLQEFVTTLLSTICCALSIFFVVLINDLIEERMLNYEMILSLWLSLFLPIYLGRCIITQIATNKIHKRLWSFETIIIGNGKVAHQLCDKLNRMKFSLGYNIIGYVDIPGEIPSDENGIALSDVEKFCYQNVVKEIIIIPTKNNIKSLLHVVNNLFPLNLPIKISPNMFHILTSKVKLSNLSGEPLVDVAGSNMSESSINIKRSFDVLLSIIFLIILIPLLIILIILIKIDSKGSVIYMQERIGYRNIPFNIYKFRTMNEDAEVGGIPQLSTLNDNRITKLGKFLRKYRLDELPQFFNVIKGDMSIVGPRPEREYYIKKIMDRAPYYALIHQVRPGITSLGMVKFGYASNVNQMIERLKYDLLYIENMSLLNDMKIMIYTIKTILTGKGL